MLRLLATMVLLAFAPCRGLAPAGDVAETPPEQTTAVRGTVPDLTGHWLVLSYIAVGLPGFQFIQDPVEYNARTHHTNMDVYERIQAADVMKDAVIVASFAYHAANRDEKLPRKSLPAPQRENSGTGR